MNLSKIKYKKILFSLVILPFLVSGIYLFFFSQNRYESLAQVVVRQSHEQPNPTAGLSLLAGRVNPTSREETLYLREYILSNDMLDLLEKKVLWHSHYSKQWQDPLYWIGDSPSREDLLPFYRRVINAHFDEITGLLTIQVEAFDPKFANEVLTIILAESERFVNEISHRMARDQVKFSQQELTLSRKNYEDTKLQLIKFQSENNLIDAQAVADSRLKMIGDLEATLAKDQARLKGLQAIFRDDTPQVRAQVNLTRSLRSQIESEKKALVSTFDDEKLNVVLARYRNLELDAKVVEESYRVSLIALENARVDATKKIRSLVTVVSPAIADDPLYPRRIYNLITVLVVLLLVYGVVRFLVATVDDHKD